MQHKKPVMRRHEDGIQAKEARKELRKEGRKGTLKTGTAQAYWSTEKDGTPEGHLCYVRTSQQSDEKMTHPSPTANRIGRVGETGQNPLPEKTRHLKIKQADPH